MLRVSSKIINRLASNFINNTIENHLGICQKPSVQQLLVSLVLVKLGVKNIAIVGIILLFV